MHLRRYEGEIINPSECIVAGGKVQEKEAACVLRTKIVPLDEVETHDRLDAEFFIDYKPVIETFFREHNAIINEGDDYIKKLMFPAQKDSEVTTRLKNSEINMVYALIKEHERLKEIQKISTRRGI